MLAKEKQSRKFRVAQEIAARKGTQEETEKAIGSSSKLFKEQEINRKTETIKAGACKPLELSQFGNGFSNSPLSDVHEKVAIVYV